MNSVQTHDHGRKDWKKVRCTYCDKEVLYVPLSDWTGKLTCPYCGKEFRVPSLDGFIS